MLSIIICSKNNELPAYLLKNIKNTVGIEYEIIHIDNSQNHYSIFQAYNKGVESANGGLLCFMHEDIMFHSNDWGKKVAQLLANHSVGMIGVSGAKILPLRGDWRFSNHYYTHVIQGHHTLGEQSIYYINGVDWDINKECRQVAIIDGCWFCIRKDLFSEGKLRFDEKNFNSFHLYDSDISMQVNIMGLKIYLCADILLEHFSEGLYSQDFKKGLETFTEKWHDYLPYSIYGKIEQSEEEESKGVDRLTRRIEDDQLVRQIWSYYESKAKGEATASLPIEAEKLIENSFYRYVKDKIKYSQTNREARLALRLYLDKGLKKHSKSLIWKYIFYRFIHSKKNQVIHFQSLNPQAFGI